MDKMSRVHRAEEYLMGKTSAYIATALADLILVMRSQNHSDTEILEAVEKALEELQGDFS